MSADKQHYVQQYVESGDAIIHPQPDGQLWWWCEHTDGSHTVLVGRGRVVCSDCGTVYMTWVNGRHNLAKPVVVRVG